MTDDDRIRLATRRGNRMLGPIERQRCDAHPETQISYRWTWRVGEAPDVGDAEFVTGCRSCAETES